MIFLHRGNHQHLLKNGSFCASFIAPIVYSARGEPYFPKTAAPTEARARGTLTGQVDPRTSTPRDIEACRNPCPPSRSRASAGKPQVRRPSASRARCLRFAPRQPRRADKGFLPAAGGRLPDGRIVRGLDRRALHRISNASHSPATAPRPASEDAVQTPLRWGDAGAFSDTTLDRPHGVERRKRVLEP